MDDKKVRITLKDGSPVPDEDPIKVKKASQKVKWYADFPFSVKIADYDEVSYGTGGGDGTHHCKTGVFNDERKHKYAITANGVTNDPILDVEP